MLSFKRESYNAIYEVTNDQISTAIKNGVPWPSPEPSGWYCDLSSKDNLVLFSLRPKVNSEKMKFIAPFTFSNDVEKVDFNKFSTSNGNLDSVLEYMSSQGFDCITCEK